MAEQMSTSIGFKQVEVLQDQVIGIGAYGKVCRAKCDSLICAAKVLHPTLLCTESLKEESVPLQQFEQECNFLGAMRHPNIVQYLGLHRDFTTESPVLLMELMDCSLTHFLESSPQPIRYHIQVNICHDITQALSFLHSNNIVHRDLSSNNILLTGNIQAKVTDFGMARLSERSRHLFTQCPGTNVYMPPEAAQDHPIYTEKIDCFSFGVIVIQILTKQFPEPGDRHRPFTLPPSASASGNQCHPLTTTLTIIPEVERRHNHISQIDQRNPLLPIALDCLRDTESERPSAQQLCGRLALLRETREYHQENLTHEDTGRREDDVWFIRHMRQVHRLIQEYANHLEEKDRRISSLEVERQQLSQQVEHRNVELQQELSQQLESNRERMRMRDQLERRKDAEVRQEMMTLRKRLEQARHDLKNKDELVMIKERELNTQREKYVQQIHVLQATNLSQKQCIDGSGAVVSHLHQIIALKEMEIIQLKRMLSQAEEQKDNISAQVEIQVEKQIKRWSRSVSHGSLSISSRVEVVSRDESQQPEVELQLKWSAECKKAPYGMAARCNAVVHGNIVYFQPANTSSVCAYDAKNDLWNIQLPNCKYRNCSMVVVDDLVTVIGGSKFMSGYIQ